MVQEIDNISHAGLTYCSLIPTTIGKDQTTDGIVEYETETQLDQGLATENEVFIPSNYPVTLKIKDGYFKSDNPSLQILSQSLASVTFSLTPGIAPVTIQYKDENGDIVEKLYTEYIND